MTPPPRVGKSKVAVGAAETSVVSQGEAAAASRRVSARSLADTLSYPGSMVSGENLAPPSLGEAHPGRTKVISARTRPVTGARRPVRNGLALAAAAISGGFCGSAVVTPLPAFLHTRLPLSRTQGIVAHFAFYAACLEPVAAGHTPFLKNLSQDCLMNRLSLPRGNRGGASHAALDHAYRMKEGQTVRILLGL